MYDKVVAKDPFILEYCLDRCKTQQMYDKAVDAFLPTSKFFTDCFVISKIIKKLNHELFSNMI